MTWLGTLFIRSSSLFFSPYRVPDGVFKSFGLLKVVSDAYETFVKGGSWNRYKKNQQF